MSILNNNRANKNSHLQTESTTQTTCIYTGFTENNEVWIEKLKPHFLCEKYNY